MARAHAESCPSFFLASSCSRAREIQAARVPRRSAEPSILDRNLFPGHELTPSPCATTEIQKNATESMTLLASKNRADSSNGDNTADSSDGSSKDDNKADSNGGSSKYDNMVDSNGDNKVGGSSADNNSRPFVCRRSRRAARAKAMRA